MRRARWKRKNVRDELTALSVNSPKTGAGRHALPTKLETPLPAALYSNLKTVRPPHQKVLRTQVLQIGRPLLLFPLSLPRLSLGGVSKGEGPQSRPFVPRGGMGDGWRPPCFWWGSKGEESLHQRFLPLALTWECPPAGARKMWGAFPTAKPCFLSRKPGLPFAL